MTTKEAKSWIERLTPGNWITIVIVISGLIGNYAVSAYQTAEADMVGKRNAEDIQDLRSDYKVIIERLNQQKETSQRIEKKLDQIIMER